MQSTPSNEKNQSNQQANPVIQSSGASTTKLTSGLQIPKPVMMAQPSLIQTQNPLLAQNSLLFQQTLLGPQQPSLSNTFNSNSQLQLLMLNSINSPKLTVGSSIQQPQASKLSTTEGLLRPNFSMNSTQQKNNQMRTISSVENLFSAKTQHLQQGQNQIDKQKSFFYQTLQGANNMSQTNCAIGVQGANLPHVASNGSLKLYSERDGGLNEQTPIQEPIQELKVRESQTEGGGPELNDEQFDLNINDDDSENGSDSESVNFQNIQRVVKQQNQKRSKEQAQPANLKVVQSESNSDRNLASASKVSVLKKPDETQEKTPQQSVTSQILSQLAAVQTNSMAQQNLPKTDSHLKLGLQSLQQNQTLQQK